MERNFRNELTEVQITLHRIMVKFIKRGIKRIKSFMPYFRTLAIDFEKIFEWLLDDLPRHSEGCELLLNNLVGSVSSK